MEHDVAELGLTKVVTYFSFDQLRVQLLQSINCLLEDGPERKRSSRSKAVSAIVVKPDENVNSHGTLNE